MKKTRKDIKEVKKGYSWTSKKILFALGVYVLFSTLLFIASLINPVLSSFVVYNMYLTGFVSVYFGYKAIRYFGRDTSLGKISLIFTLAYLAWTLGDIIWAFFNFKVISLADLVWYWGYLLFFTGCISLLNFYKLTFLKQKKRIVLLLISSLLVSFLYLRFAPFSWNAEVPMIENIVNGGYVLSDLILINLVVFIVSFVIKEQSGKAWLFTAFGGMMWWLADMSYSMNYLEYIPGSWYNFFKIFGYIFYTITFIKLTEAIDLSNRNSKENPIMRKNTTDLR